MAFEQVSYCVITAVIWGHRILPEGSLSYRNIFFFFFSSKTLLSSCFKEKKKDNIHLNMNERREIRILALLHILMGYCYFLVVLSDSPGSQP